MRIQFEKTLQKFGLKKRLNVQPFEDLSSSSDEEEEDLLLTNP